MPFINGNSRLPFYRQELLTISKFFYQIRICKMIYINYIENIIHYKCND